MKLRLVLFLLHCNFKTALKHQYTEYKQGTKQNILRKSTAHVNRHQYIARKGDTVLHGGLLTLQDSTQACDFNT